MNEDANTTAFQIMRYVITHSAYYVWNTQTTQVFFLPFFKPEAAWSREAELSS